MDKVPIKITNFLKQHHILCLSTYRDNLPSTCTLFYAYYEDNNSCIIASNTDTQHIQNSLLNNQISGAIFLSTDIIGKIEGVQFRGEISRCENEKEVYFKKFPYSLLMNPTLWNIKITYLKMTNNKLGFGKKIIWKQDF